MPRSIASATISFGLVAVPVELYSAADTRDEVHFHLISKKSGQRVKQQYIDPTTDEVIPRNQLVKGYEVRKDEYVIFTPEELKALDEKATGSIDITEFVMLSDVDREYLEKVYFLGPGKGGERPYRLLAKALQDTGRAALGQYAARGRQYLVLLRPRDGVLVMEQLHYANELRSPDEIPVGDSDVKASELTLAKKLIDQGATDRFDPSKYKDSVRERVAEAMQRKVEGEDITEAEAPQAGGGKVLDLVQALKASLERDAPPRAARRTGRRQATARKSSRSRKSA
ncbi:MAG: Ku protein [Gemmatimonadaceae bacterium]|nr:Ku protein [Gemmatimonadaceae bacterium]